MTEESSFVLRPLSSEGWPSLGEQALQGLAGETVRTVSPTTEADPAHVLLNFLAIFGAAVGKGPHVLAGNVPHAPRLFVAIVGKSAKGRKGTAHATARPFFEVADETFMTTRTHSGMGSGEILIDLVKDPDDGAPAPRDHRLLIREGEFARVLKVCNREGSILSAVLRDSWDGLRLASISRGISSVSTNHHITVIADITVDELRMRLSDTDSSNGFGNRFLFVLGQKAQSLPEGGNVDSRDVDRLGLELRGVLEAARKVGEVKRSPDALGLWAEMYRTCDDDDPGGLFGSIIARDQQQILRLSLIYALLDGKKAIEQPHLLSAWDVWHYCHASAGMIFGDRTGHPLADRILNAIVAKGRSGLNRTGVSRALSNNASAKEIDVAIEYLIEHNRIEEMIDNDTGGRAATIYVPVLTKEDEGTKEAPDPSSLSFLSSEENWVREPPEEKVA